MLDDLNCRWMIRTAFKMQTSLNSDRVVSGFLKVSRAQKSPNTIMSDKQQYSQKWTRL